MTAGQAAVEMIDPQSLWINARFDQIGAGGLAAGLPAEIRLRSRRDEALTGTVVRVEPLADPVTEETLAKISLQLPLGQLPPVGELAEVNLTLPALAPTIVIPSAAIQRVGDAIGVWLIAGNGLEFRAVRLGLRDLDGHVQVLEGLRRGQRILV